MAKAEGGPDELLCCDQLEVAHQLDGLLLCRLAANMVGPPVSIEDYIIPLQRAASLVGSGAVLGCVRHQQASTACTPLLRPLSPVLDPPALPHLLNVH